jgi:integrase
MIDDMQLRNLTPATQRNYIHHVAALAKYYQVSPEHLDLEDIRQYELYLLNERKLAAETINGFVSAVKFLYQVTLEMPWSDAVFPRVRRPRTLPVVLSQEEVVQFFDHIPSLKFRAILLACYGAGLRVSEAVALKVTDIDSKRMLIRVEQGKGRKDRYAMLSPRLLEVLRTWCRAARAERVAVPGLARRPAPGAQFRAALLPRSLAALRLAQESIGAHPAPQLRHAPAGERHRYPRHPGAARTQLHRQHGPLHRRFAASGQPHAEPTGYFAPPQASGL